MMVATKKRVKMSRRVPEVESHHGNKSPPPPSPSHINICRTSEEMLEFPWHGNQPTKLHHAQSENSNNTSSLSQPPPPPSTADNEMEAWIHYPLSFNNLYTDPNNPNSSTQPPPRPPPYLSKQPFSTVTSQPVETAVVPPEMTVVESCGSPTTVAGDGSGVKLKKSGGSGDSTAYTWSYSESETNTTTTDNTKTNTTSDTISDNEVTSEDAELECVAAKKLKCHNGSTSSMRSCASEVHNPPQRKHRDRVKEKMKALQELIPNLDKSDESSMLDNVIHYMKALQMHVQMMSMGCPIDPSMFPGSQPPYVQPTGMGMGMARPVMTTYTSPVPYPGLLTTSPVGVLLPNQATTSTQLPCVLPPMHPVPAPGFSVMQPTTLPINTTISSLPLQPSGMQPYPNVGNPYQQYMAVPQMQMQMPMPRIETPMQFVQNTSPSQPAPSSETGMSVTGKENTDKKDG